MRTYNVRHQHLCSGMVQSSEDWPGGPRLPQQEPLSGQWQQVSCQLGHTIGYIKFLITLDEVLTSHGSTDIDFLLPSIGPNGLRIPLQPMSYAEGLYFLRRFLSLPLKQKPLSVGASPSSYTIHGLKSTLISWATQLDL